MDPLIVIIIFVVVIIVVTSFIIIPSSDLDLQSNKDALVISCQEVDLLIVIIRMHFQRLASYKYYQCASASHDTLDICGTQ